MIKGSEKESILKPPKPEDRLKIECSTPPHWLEIKTEDERAKRAASSYLLRR